MQFIMYVYTCMCLCVYVCLCMRVYVYMCVHACVRAVCVYVHASVYCIVVCVWCKDYTKMLNLLNINILES